MLHKIENQKGYVALIGLLIVAAATLTIGLAVSLRGIDEIQTSFSLWQAAKSKSLANACTEDALERLRGSWTSYSDSLAIGDNSCIINVIVNGNNATLYATGTVDIYTQKIEVQIDNNLDIIYWQED